MLVDFSSFGGLLCVCKSVLPGILVQCLGGGPVSSKPTTDGLFYQCPELLAIFPHASAPEELAVWQ